MTDPIPPSVVEAAHRAWLSADYKHGQTPLRAALTASGWVQMREANVRMRDSLLSARMYLTSCGYGDDSYVVQLIDAALKGEQQSGGV